ncbi:hypothetical protein ANN_08954 [Periplaneta americana]|uniref:Uncharacterized protein n=1 Tax=Periplaneta americana TaxID=6978 RepID=A0ABQ8T4X7_PERAM|nr:hypothetical protein ANN_08954 [Periplaneta americana]
MGTKLLCNHYQHQLARRSYQRPARERCITISEIGFTECSSCVIARARVLPPLARDRPGDRSPVGTSARFNHRTRSSMLQYCVVQHW